MTPAEYRALADACDAETAFTNSNYANWMNEVGAALRAAAEQAERLERMEQALADIAGVTTCYHGERETDSAGCRAAITLARAALRGEEG